MALAMATRSALVSITNATEWGTVYDPDQVAALASVAHAAGLPLHMDGARFANAVAGLDCAPADLVRGVDALCLDGRHDRRVSGEKSLEWCDYLRLCA